MRVRNYISQYGNKKGYILTLDAALALVIATIIFLVSGYFAVLVGGERISPLHISNTGNDVLAVLHHKGTLATLDEAAIQSNMTALLPVQFDMMINLNSSSDSYTAATSSVIPNATFIASGERFFISNTGSNYHATFKIWLK